MTSGRAARARAVSIDLAVVNDDYYAEVRAKLKGEARRAFERAVDTAWRKREAPPAHTN